MLNLIFRKFDSLVPAKNFLTKNHKYILKYPGSSINPANYYFNPREVILQGHNYNAFQLSLITYELTRKSLNHSYQSEKNQALQTSDLAKDYLNETYKFLNAKNNFDIPIQVCTNIIYSSENLNASNKEFYIKYLFPIIINKMEYMSLQGAIDLLTGLVKAELFENKNILKSICEVIKNKEFDPEFINCSYTFTELENYQNLEEKSSDKPGENNVGYYELFMNFFRINVYYPLFLREKRVKHLFSPINQIKEIEHLKKSLEILLNKTNEKFVKELVENLNQRNIFSNQDKIKEIEDK